jgi:raffinose/stachyose/melibiose transport system substrate-binding protein
MTRQISTLSRRRLLQLLGTTAAGMTLAACVPAAPQGGQGAEEAPSQAATIIKFDAGSLTPSKFTGQQLAEGAPDLVGFELIAAAYKEIKPDVTIEFQAIPMGNRREAAVTMLSGGTAPDISWAQPDWVNEDLGKGWWLDLDPFLETPNEYAPEGHEGRESWHASFYPSVDFWRAPDGHLYMLLGDQTAVGTYYNKDLFQEAGITASKPADWAELMTFCAQLQEIGYPGFSWVASGEPAMHQITWVSGWLSKYFYWSKIPLYDQDDNGWPDKWEMADAVQAGDYSAAMDEQVARLRTLKDLAQYWQEGAMGMENEAAYRHFLAGNGAMLITTLGQLTRFLNDPERKFELGWFYFPPVTAATWSGIAADVPMTNVASGYGAFQYSLTSTALANNTVETSADFLKFATTPENITTIVSERPSTIPNIKGGAAHPMTEELGFSEVVAYPASTFQEDDSMLDFEFGMNFTSVVVPYCVGQMAEEEMLPQLQAYLETAAERVQAIRPA